ncbi:hypothetical protein BY458DRAFT_523117 [Sporodiniella umbellata]|nr:hypothetical protein BY458DRAFT_523117 [Sporodiniella umbellata]
MEPLYEKLLKKYFPTSVLAIEYCRAVCGEYGFTVKQEASANKNIYVYCSREGLPDSQRNPKPSPQRKRPSKRCDCRWRVVLSENEGKQWEFRKSMNPTASEHNHAMMSPNEMVKAWPVEVNTTIIQLARQKLQTHEIREAVRHSFPEITWNERRFYNRLTEERKRMRQRGVVERAQRLLTLSGKLCALVASSELWATTLEEDLKRMLQDFCQLARFPTEAIPTLTDLQPQMIKLDSDGWVSAQHVKREAQDLSSSPMKKLKSVSNMDGDESPKGVQRVHVPSYTLQLYQDKRTALDTAIHPHFFSMTSPASSSSSTCSVPFKKQCAIASPPTMHDYALSYPQPPFSQPAFAHYGSFGAHSTTSPEMSFFEPALIEREPARPTFYSVVNKATATSSTATFSPSAPSHFSLPMIRSSKDSEHTHWH